MKLFSASVPVFIVPPTNLTALDGKDATITCQAEGAPTPNVTWHFNGNIILLLMQLPYPVPMHLEECRSIKNVIMIMNFSVKRKFMQSKRQHFPHFNTLFHLILHFMDETSLQGTDSFLEGNLQQNKKIPMVWLISDQYQPLTL